jgi:hypothetical protein
MINFSTIVTGSIAAGNLLCDSTDANAFCAPVGLDLTPYRGKQIEFWSGTTLWAQAWISATAPSGEDTSSVWVSNFSAGVDGTDAARGIVAGNIDSIGGQDDNARFTCGAELDSHYIRKSSITTVGRRYQLVFDYYIPSGQSNIDTIGLTSTTTGGITSLYSTLDTWTSISTKDYTANYQHVLITAYDGTAETFSDASANDVFYIKNVILNRVTMPAATGALLLSTQGGSRGWQYKHASFNPNAALTYRILDNKVYANPLKYMGAKSFYN